MKPNHPRFSVFDATERPQIARSLESLKHRGLIEYPKPQPGYPWMRVHLTDAGLAIVAELRLESAATGKPAGTPKPIEGPGGTHDAAATKENDGKQLPA